MGIDNPEARPNLECMDHRLPGDHDVPYTFGQLPHAITTAPFTTREFARLLVYRSRVQEGLAGLDDTIPNNDELIAPPSRKALAIRYGKL